MKKTTHAAFGLAIAMNLGLDPIYVMMGSLLPDFDYVCCHRRLLHNVFILLLASLYSIHIGVGVLSHLLLDMMTVSGVALFFPLSNKRYRIAEFRTGSIVDLLLFILFCVLAWFGANS